MRVGEPPSTPFSHERTSLPVASIVPTREFFTWRSAVKAGKVPTLEPARLRAVRSIIHLELVGIVIILLCAALMAKGIGTMV